MKILYIVSRPLQINSSAAIRNKATIKGILELGHNVHLITTRYDDEHQNYYKQKYDGSLETTYVDIGGIQDALKIGRKIKISKNTKMFLYKLYKKLINPKEIYDDYKGIINKIDYLNLNISEYDIIITSSDPKSSHLFGIEIFKKFNIQKPWVQIWGDPFATDITIKNKKIKYDIKKEEKKILDKATSVVYVSSITKDLQKKLYPENEKKMHYIPTPYLEKRIYDEDKHKGKELTFLYCGDYYKNIRNINPLYKAILESNYKLIICGRTDINIKNNDRVSVYPRVSLERVKQLESECDILVHLSNIKGSQIPGKIYHYSGTNKPILFILDGKKESIKTAFEDYNRYIFCNNNQQSIKMTLDSIIDSMTKVNNEVIKEFSPKEVAWKILETAYYK